MATFELRDYQKAMKDALTDGIQPVKKTFELFLPATPGKTDGWILGGQYRMINSKTGKGITPFADFETTIPPKLEDSIPAGGFKAGEIGSLPIHYSFEQIYAEKARLHSIEQLKSDTTLKRLVGGQGWAIETRNIEVRA